MRGAVKTDAIKGREIDLSRFSFGPYWLVQALPWLLLATVLRHLRIYPNPVVVVVATILESVAIFLALLAATRRLTELSRGRIRLEDWGILRQLDLARDIVLRVYLLLFAVAAVVFAAGAYKTALHVLFAFGGIAFDQLTKIGMVASSTLAAIVLMMVVNAEKSKPSTVLNAVRELARHALWMVPALVVVAAVHVGLNYVQGLGRGLVYLFGQTSASQFIKNVVFFLFVFGFATLRLWATVTILAFALGMSFRYSRHSPHAA